MENKKPTCYFCKEQAKHFYIFSGIVFKEYQKLVAYCHFDLFSENQVVLNALKKITEEQYMKLNILKLIYNAISL